MLFKKEKYQIKTNSIGFYQDLEHIDGLGISSISANLYKDKKRDDIVLFYFRKGASHASVYTQSNIKSERFIVVGENKSYEEVFKNIAQQMNLKIPKIKLNM